MTSPLHLHFSRFLFLLLMTLVTVPFISCKDQDESIFREETLPAQFLDIGPGRNDGINRAYGLILTSPFVLSGLREYTYEHGKWERTGTVTENPAGWAWLDDLKGDNKRHVIALGHTYIEDSYNIKHQYFTELTYREGVWEHDTIYATENEVIISGFTSGKFSDTQLRSLILLERTFEEGRVLEVYYFENDWHTRTIEVSGLEDPIVGMESGDVSGAGKDNVYVSTQSGHLYEFTYNEAWNKTELPQIYPGEPGVNYAHSFLLKVTEETNSLYVMGFEDFYEYSYENGSWSRAVISEDVVGPFEIEYGDVRNDGANRLYMPAIFGTIIEVTPGSTGETINYHLNGTEAIQSLLIANGRNDGVNRVYIAQGFTENLELTYR